jgi:hypothetical protein
MRKAEHWNPRSPWILSHLSEFVFRLVPFVASRAVKWAQKDPGRQGFDQADCFLRRRNPWSESCSPRKSRPGIRLGGFVISNTNDFKFDCDSMFQVTKGARRKGNLQTDWSFPPDKRTWWQQERRRDLWRDVMKRRLRGDLFGDFLEVAQHILLSILFTRGCSRNVKSPPASL